MARTTTLALTFPCHAAPHASHMTEQARAEGLHRTWLQGRDSLARLENQQCSDPAAFRYGRKMETLGAEAARQAFSENEIRRLARLLVQHRAPFGPSFLLLLL